MPLTQQDVLDTLSSYFVQLIDFRLGDERISSVNYNGVKTQIEDGRIQIVPGPSATIAKYYSVGPKRNTLETQNVASPPTIDGRALLIHECTHAIVNLEKRAVTDLTNETMGYIAQHTYLLLANPLYEAGPNPSAAWFQFFKNTLALVRKFKLHKPEGRGATLKLLDYLALRTELSRLPGANYDTKGILEATEHTGPSPHLPNDARFSSTSNESYPEANDQYLTETLKKRYSASDVIGYGGRVKQLEQIFSHMEPIRAHALQARLAIRRQGDPMSIYFHDHLSTVTRTSLLGIMAARH